MTPPEAAAPPLAAAPSRERARITVRGAVQGVGFRPFVHHLATSSDLCGWVTNTTQGVSIEVEGRTEAVERFVARLEAERPAAARVEAIELCRLEPAGYERFEILSSDASGTKSAWILPDLALCPACRREITNPRDRRYRYPFTNCTHCGPRFSIIEAMPYDRSNTSMRLFPMCAECLKEYENPVSRRFHAQPNACPHCGPHLELWDDGGSLLGAGDAALRQAASALKGGRIVALKGVGGFHLLVDARNDEAVWRLRSLKQRERKPFAVMFPSLEQVRAACEVNPSEEQLLLSIEAPIVLLRRKPRAELSRAVGPGNPNVGVMLAYSPLHFLLLRDFGGPIVATSGNRSDEPICTDEREALIRLRGIAGVFLVHNRPIVRPIDDSVVRVTAGRELVLRRARGYAPLPVRLPHAVPSLLAAGAHLKNTVALAVGQDVYLSQHIGDLGSLPALAAFERASADLPRLYEANPQAMACDLHPDYASTRFARAAGKKVVPVQHHYAHVLACMAEHGLAAPVLGVCWDGAGLGADGTSWGGEFLIVDDRSYRRAGHLRRFRLAGGDAAARQPSRSALGLLFEVFGQGLFARDSDGLLGHFSRRELGLLRTMLERGINSPFTSSAGRLFDGVAALVGLGGRSLSFEGQAAMDLEFAADRRPGEAYPFGLVGRDPFVVDWQPVLLGILGDLAARRTAGEIAARFHATLVVAITAAARRIGLPDVVLTGGCFQNALLLEGVVQALRGEGIRPHWPERIPPNDGGIALGQIVAAARDLADPSCPSLQPP
jgi:hydrogenase maturation protein HypF